MYFLWLNINTLSELVNKNLSSYEIAKELNCSQTNVRYWLKKHGLKTIKPQQPTKSKVCSKCDIEKSIGEFYKRNDNRIHHWCINCFNKSTQQTNNTRRVNRKKKLVDLYGGKCINCGYNRNYASLHFHHKDPTQKTFNLDSHHVAALNWKILLNEANKCELLCGNCHGEHHHPHLNKY